jgi:hypothetical protein
LKDWLHYLPFLRGAFSAIHAQRCTPRGGRLPFSLAMFSALQKDVVADNEMTAERHNVTFIIDGSFAAILTDDYLQMLHTTDVRLSLFRVFRKVLEVAAVCGV